MTHPNLDKESQNLLDAYIHDYLEKRKYSTASKTFQAEAEVSTDLNVIDAPSGFLYEWWSVFWDIFIARYMVQVPGAVVSCNETQIVHEQEQQKQQQWHQNSHRHQQYNMHIQELLLQKKIQQQKQLLQLLLQQQQRREETTQHQNGIRQQRISNVSTARMYQEGLKVPVPNDHLDDTNMKPGFGDNMGHLLDPNHGTIPKSLAGHTPHATSGCISSYLHPTKHEGVLPLKGWPLMGLDHLRPRLLQQQKPMIQSPQASHQLQLQRRLILQAQQNLPSSSVNDLECRKLWMLLNEQNMGSDGVGVRVGHPVLSHGDLDVLIKKQMQNSNEHQQQYPRGGLSKQSQNSNYHFLKQDKTVGAGRITLEGCLSSTARGNDQASKIQTGKKRKRLISSSVPAAATSSTTGPSPSSATSTPSSHTKEDVLSTPTLHHKEGLSQPACMVGNSCGGLFASATNHLGPMLDESVDTFLSHDDVGGGVDTCGGFSFSEIGSIHANQIDHCHLSLDGKLLVTSGNDKKAKLWCTDLLEQKCTLEEHSHAITDTRFSPFTPWLATSSLDKTIRIWDVENPGHSLYTFVGHSASVMSLDFHPNKGDLICSCDDINEIRYWSIKNGGCARVIKGGSATVRFQPTLGRYIAAAVGNSTSIMDVETAVTCGNPLKGHSLNVQSICWDFSGELLASVSEDLVKVWKIGSGAQHNCIHELSFSAKKFRCCVFHPYYPSLLVIGCSQSLELWNMAENKLMTPLGEPISALAVSGMTGLVASASRDNYIKMWKWI